MKKHSTQNPLPMFLKIKTIICVFILTIVIPFQNLTPINLANASSYENIEGPIPAVVIKVIDGDTIVVKARIWLNQDVETLVRIRGVDTPELKGKCEEEKYLAQQAKEFVQKRINKNITLHNIKSDKYGNRVVANINYHKGNKTFDLATDLIESGIAVPYEGRKRKSWCENF